MLFSGHTEESLLLLSKADSVTNGPRQQGRTQLRLHHYLGKLFLEQLPSNVTVTWSKIKQLHNIT